MKYITILLILVSMGAVAQNDTLWIADSSKAFVDSTKVTYYQNEQSGGSYSTANYFFPLYLTAKVTGTKTVRFRYRAHGFSDGNLHLYRVAPKKWWSNGNETKFTYSVDSTVMFDLVITDSLETGISIFVDSVEQEVGQNPYFKLISAVIIGADSTVIEGVKLPLKSPTLSFHEKALLEYWTVKPTRKTKYVLPNMEYHGLQLKVVSHYGSSYIDTIRVVVHSDDDLNGTWTLLEFHGYNGAASILMDKKTMPSNNDTLEFLINTHDVWYQPGWDVFVREGSKDTTRIGISFIPEAGAESSGDIFQLELLSVSGRGTLPNVELGPSTEALDGGNEITEPVVCVGSVDINL